jgi:putative ATP-dependent endonuclease of OLD family
VCSHSPRFIPGDDFETVRVVRDSGIPSCSSVKQLTYHELSQTLSTAGQPLLKEQGMLARLYPSLNPGVNEMFFCRVLILVEGIEDVAHLTTYLSLLGLMPKFRKSGCHIVPVGGKSEIVKPLAMAKQLDIPVFVIIDADTDTVKPEHITKHEQDNKSILSLMGYSADSEWPTSDIWKTDFVMWKDNLTKLVEAEIGVNWQTHVDTAATFYGQPGGLKKNPLAISRALEAAWIEGEKSASLEKLASDLISFSEKAVES